MPSAPEKIGARGEAERPPAGREYTSFDSVEQGTATVPAGTTPTPVFTFSGLPDSIMLQANGGTAHFVRFRNPGEAPTGESLLISTIPIEFQAGYRIVEVRDATAAGGQTLIIVGRYGSRHVERRASRRGPLKTSVHDYDTANPEQVTPR